MEAGKSLSVVEKRWLLDPQRSGALLDALELSEVDRGCIEMNRELLSSVEEAKERLKEQILGAIEPLQEQVELLISIKGITELIARRGVGRARIAVIRKVCGIMRRMLLSGERYRWVDETLYQSKLNAYRKAFKKSSEEQKSARL